MAKQQIHLLGVNRIKKIKKITANGNEIAIVNSDEILISDVQSALDFMMSVNYETGSHSIVLNKEAVTPDFFVLSTRIAGEILQKFINYQFKLAIVGDLSGYTSKPLKDFIYESNKEEISSMYLPKKMLLRN